MKQTKYINGGWELRDTGYICRWLFVFTELTKDEYVGALSGYSGGGCFEVEQFYCKVDNDEVTSFWLDETDRVNDASISIDSLGEKAIELIESCFKELWMYNDRDAWSESDQLLLLKKKVNALMVENDMLLYTRHKSALVQQLCELAGLTAGPSDD
jgi:hypothetical protein